MDENQTTLLINFRIPKDIKVQFQDTCRAKHTSMTTELVRFVNDYLASDLAKRLEQQRMRNHLNGTKPYPRRVLVDPDTGLPLN